jgi:NTP pyrophosphatase (non-canonical NTP hydrolase)
MCEVASTVDRLTSRVVTVDVGELREEVGDEACCCSL